MIFLGQEEKRKMDENLQRLKIEMLRKSSADISGRGSVGPTSLPDSSSFNAASKKGPSTSRGGTINGGRQSTDTGKTVPRSKSLIATKATLGTTGSFSSLSQAAAAAAAAMPSSGSNSLSAKRGSLPINLTPSPGSRKPPSVPSSSPSPGADAAPSKPDQVPRRNSVSKRL